MKFIQVEIEVYNRELANLGINQDGSFWAEGCINEEDVSAIREMPEEPDRCNIYLKSGESFVIRMHFYEAIYWPNL